MDASGFQYNDANPFLKHRGGLVLSSRAITGFGALGVLLVGLIQPLAGETYQLILRGKVSMKDGSALPKQTGIERVCSDGAGSAPGPLTDKNGQYLWRMEVDPMRTRSCHLQATSKGYTSTSIDISALNGYTDTQKELPALILSPRTESARALNSSDSDVPSGARSAWKAAMKAIDSGNLPEAASQLRSMAAAAPKFARGWQTLGIVYETIQMPAEAREAYQHAVEADPKQLVSWITLAHMDILAKDWQGAATASETAIRLDTKHAYPEIYLHQAAARLKLKDLPGAEASTREALRDPKQNARAELILAQILDARADYPGAREHAAKYLELEPTAADADQIKAWSELLGKPEAAGVEPQPERP